MSIDATVVQINNSSAQNLNYIDSYVEYIAEIVLKFQNAIPELKHRHEKELQMHKQLQVICQITYQPLFDRLPHSSIINLYHQYSDKYTGRFIKEINPPPPKFA